MNIKNLFFKYCVYYPVLIIRNEWFLKESLFFKKSQFYTRQQIKDIQLKKLNSLLSSAKTSPHYVDKVSLIENLVDVQKIPFLSKEILRNSSEKLLTSHKFLFKTVKTSGGSTGAPVTLFKPAHAMASELAATWRGYQWAGINIGDLQARFWGVPHTKKARSKAQLIDFVAHRIRISAFKLSDDDLDGYVKIIEKKKPDYFYGYVSIMEEFAHYLKRINYRLAHAPKAIITTSEVLSEHTRSTLTEVFGAPVYNEYGCGEVGTIAHECEYGSLHINEENILIEIVDDEGNALPDNNVGNVVVTDLNNNLMPLIRYQLKDFASLSHRACPCNRGLAILENITGRAYDFLINEHGTKFHGEYFLYHIYEMKKHGYPLDGIQFLFKDNFLNIHIIASPDNYKYAVKILSKVLTTDFSKIIPLQFTRVENIERERSGKLRLIKNWDIESNV